MEFLLDRQVTSKAKLVFLYQLFSYITCTTPEQVHKYFSERKTLLDAHQYCLLRGGTLANYNVSVDVAMPITNVTIWSGNFTAYSPWLQMEGCVVLDENITSNAEDTKSCWHNCRMQGFQYIALQAEACVCLKSLPTTRIQSVHNITQMNTFCKENFWSLYSLTDTEYQGLSFTENGGQCMTAKCSSNFSRVHLSSANCDSQFHGVCENSTSRGSNLTQIGDFTYLFDEGTMESLQNSCNDIHSTLVRDVTEVCSSFMKFLQINGDFWTSARRMPTSTFYVGTNIAECSIYHINMDLTIDHVTKSGSPCHELKYPFVCTFSKPNEERTTSCARLNSFPGTGGRSVKLTTVTPGSQKTSNHEETTTSFIRSNSTPGKGEGSVKSTTVIPDSPKTLNYGLIIGAVAGACIMVVIVMCAFLLKKRYKYQTHKNQQTGDSRHNVIYHAAPSFNPSPIATIDSNETAITMIAGATTTESEDNRTTAYAVTKKAMHNMTVQTTEASSCRQDLPLMVETIDERIIDYARPIHPEPFVQSSMNECYAGVRIIRKGPDKENSFNIACHDGHPTNPYLTPMYDDVVFSETNTEAGYMHMN